MRRDSGFRRNLEKAGLVSAADGRFHTYLQAQHGVWVPPDVWIDQGCTKYTAGQPCVIYPVPAALAETDGTRIRSKASFARELPRFEEAGWTVRQTDTTQDALLNDFLALADALPLTAALLAGDIDSAWIGAAPEEWLTGLAAAMGITADCKVPVFREVTRGLPPADAVLNLLREEHEKVAAFARKWGPLWLNPTHRGDYWTLLPISVMSSDRVDLAYLMDLLDLLDLLDHVDLVDLAAAPLSSPRTRRDSLCWPGCEPVVAFYFHAAELKAALAIGASLAQGQTAPDALWSRLGFADIGADYYVDAGKRLDEQRRTLAGLLTAKLKDPEGVRLRFSWDAKGKPILEFSTGFGFLGLVWAQVAQAIAGQKGLYVCDACGRPFVRSRRLASDRFKFCPLCSENGKGSKKLWYRRRQSPTQGN